MTDSCLSCKHCDTSRKNDLGEVRCTKFSIFVKPSDNCQYHSNKGLLNFAEELRKSGVNYDK